MQSKEEEILPQSLQKAKDHNLFFTSLTKLIKETHKQNGDTQIQNQNVEEYVTESTQIRHTIEKLENYIQQNPKHFEASKNGQFNLNQIFFYMTGKDLLLGMTMCLTQNLLNCGNIFILNEITTRFKDLNGQTKDQVILSLLIASLVLIYFIRSILISQYKWFNSKWQAGCKTTLQYLIFKKALKTQNFQQDETQQNSQHIPDINNAMTVDIDQTLQFFFGLVEGTCALVTSVVLVYLIFIMLDNSISEGLLFLLGAILFNILAILFEIFLVRRQYKIKDERLQLSEDVFEGIKSIKYLGWEEHFKQKIDKIRNHELLYIFHISWQNIFQLVFWNCLSYFLLFFFFRQSYYADKDRFIKETNVFSIIIISNSLTYPIGIFPSAISMIFKTVVSLRRIQRLLNQKEIQPENRITSSKKSLDDQEGSEQEVSINSKYVVNSKIRYSISLMDEKFDSKRGSLQNRKNAISITNCIFKWPEITQNKQNLQQGDKNQNTIVEVDSQLNEPILEKNQKEVFELKIEKLKIKQGTLNFVIGPIGGGKTALMQSILNEMDLHELNTNENKLLQSNKSKLFVEGKVSYVSQNHWLQNLSVKQNILFGKEYDSEWYQKCVSACELYADFNFEQGGDERIIGPGGNNLSGGQKQRLALCRAIYQDNDIYLLDDIFSSLDYNVAEKVYENAIIQLLLLQKNKTILLITSQNSFLKKKQFFSKIIYLKNGLILNNQIEIDNFIKGKNEEEVNRNRSSIQVQDYKQILNQFQKPHEQEEEQKQVIEENEEDNTTFENQLQNEQFVNDIFLNNSQYLHQQSRKISFQRFSNVNQIKSYNVSQTVSQTISQSYSTKSQQNFNRLQAFQNAIEQNQVSKLKSQSVRIQNIQKIEKLPQVEIQIKTQNNEKRVQGSIKLSTLILYLKCMGFVFGILYFLTTLITQGAQMFIDFWLKSFFSRKSGENDFFTGIDNYFQNDFQTIFMFFILIFLANSFIRNTLYAVCNFLASKRIFYKLNKSIMYSKMKFFDENPVGRIIARVSDDVVNVDDILPESINKFTKLIGIVAGCLIGVMVQLYWMVIFVIVALLAMKRLQGMFRMSNREIKRLNQVNGGKVLSIISETCKGLAVIRAFNKEKFILKQYLEALSESINTYLLSQAIQVWMLIRLQTIFNVLFTMVGISSIFVVFFTSFFESIGINYAVVSMCLSYVLMLSGRFSDVMFQFFMVEQQIISVERIGQYLENEQEKINIPIKQTLAIKQSNPENLSNEEIQQNHCIMFKNVCFAYDENAANAQQYVLKNFSLQIKKGEKVAFCGRTGSGKTSILNILFGMYQIQEGEIFINNKNQKEYSLKELRSQMSIIPQFGFLYNATLKDNLDPSGRLNQETISYKINQTGLKLRKNEQDNDLQFQVNQGGENLSNGEKQIINFFRIILQDTEIICLDEATSNMDPQTDEQLNQKLFEFAEGKTLIVVTHRLDNIEKFDKVVVLEKGQIIECGHVNELKQKQNGFFNQLLNKKN